jgi:hypothetical protein
MSLYKIDGFVLSVDEFYTWIAGFVTLYRRGKLRRKKLPQEIVDIMKREKEDRHATQHVLEYLEEHEDFMAEFVRIIKEGMADLAIEKESAKPRK